MTTEHIDIEKIVEKITTQQGISIPQGITPQVVRGNLMLIRRKRWMNAISTDIAEMKRAIITNQSSINNFQTRGSGDAEYNATRIENSTRNIDDLRLQISRAEQKITRIEEGLLDSEIEKEIAQAKDIALKKSEQTKLVIDSDNACKEAGKIKSKAFYQIERNAKYNDRTLEKELAKYWDATATLPPNIVKNIESTPCNRGYRYRGVCFFGKRPEQKPDMMFQKSHEGTLITEITDTHITNYIKPFNGANKSQISKHRRQVTDSFTAPAKLTKV